MPSLFALDWVCLYDETPLNEISVLNFGKKVECREQGFSVNFTKSEWGAHLAATGRYLDRFKRQVQQRFKDAFVDDAFVDETEFTKQTAARACVLGEKTSCRCSAKEIKHMIDSRYTLLVPPHIKGALIWFNNEATRIQDASNCSYTEAIQTMFRLKTRRQGSSEFLPFFHHEGSWHEEQDFNDQKCMQLLVKSIHEETWRIVPDYKITVSAIKKTIGRLLGVIAFVEGQTLKNTCYDETKRMRFTCIAGYPNVEVRKIRLNVDHAPAQKEHLKQIFRLKKRSFPTVIIPDRLKTWLGWFETHEDILWDWYFIPHERGERGERGEKDSIKSMCMVEKKKDEWFVWDLTTAERFRKKNFAKQVLLAVLNEVPLGCRLKLHIEKGKFQLEEMYVRWGFSVDRAVTKTQMGELYYSPITNILYTITGT